MTKGWRTKVETLPIAKHLSNICEGVSEHPITLLEAPPGTGKTTVLPLALLEHLSLEGGSILILQPRRIAAKSVASRMAELLNEQVGTTVGYSVRLESKRSKSTRIEVITEGLLTRRLIADPSLSGVGAVIFDEFHERSMHADVSLALTLETISVLRPDLKLVIMSATLGESLPKSYLSTAWRYTFDGNTFPVTIRYEPGDNREPIWQRVGSAIKSAVVRYEGDLLAFLPGAFEIRRTQEILERSRMDGIVVPLYGDLPFHQQAAAMYRDPQGRRKIVLATTIAETSLTIEGVTTVIDSGTHKVARVTPSGLSSLSTEPISRDAADQRAGRAGRTAPGVCIRLWSEQEHLTRRPFREPEVLRSDLTAPLLDLAAWGIHDPEHFTWVSPPPRASLESGRDTLRALRAINHDGAITNHGRTLASLGAHPRLGNLATTARALSCEPLAARLITILEERDILGPTSPSASIHTRLDAFSTSGRQRHSAHRLVEMSDRWLDRILSIPAPSSRSSFEGPEEDVVALLLGSAFPERIARRREEDAHRYLLASGKGASLKVEDPLRQAEFIVACDIQETGGDLAIRIAAPLSAHLLHRELSHLLSTRHEVRLDAKTGALSASEVTRIGAILVASRTGCRASDEEISAAFCAWLESDEGWQKIPWSDEILALLSRLHWARMRQGDAPTLPDLSKEALRSSITDWLLPHLPTPPSLKGVTERVVTQAIEAMLPWSTKKELDDIAPATYTIPTGRARPLDYSAGNSPRFEARIQDLFGLLDTPRIGRLRVPATILLLSPAHRPVQVTQDLANFWRVGYPEVRKELRGRYPKHKWPEDPLEKLS